MYIELQRGRSFRGLSKYCLYDVGSGSSDRVEFVETRNLATDNAEAAWRIMASKHYMQNELKARAGVAVRKNDGRPVGHMFISWGKEEADAQQLQRDGMVRAVDGALKSIGADQHEALIVAHSDTADANPHCHVVINLIGDDGRLKKNWKEREKLSKFALEEEIRVHGKPVVADRHKRWHDREAGEVPPPRKKKARHLYELEKTAEQDNALAGDAKRLLALQKGIEQKKAEQKERHRRNRERLREVSKEREQRIKNQNEALIRRVKTNARKLYDEPWKELHADQQLERDEFEAKEKTVRGSVENGLRMVDWFEVFKRPKDSGKASLKDLFQILTSEGKRREVLMKRQSDERNKMRSDQRKAEREASALAKELQTNRLEAARKSYVLKAGLMKQRQRVNREQLKADQKAVTQERNTVLKEFRQQELERKKAQTLRRKLQREFEEASEREGTEGDTDRTEQGSDEGRQSNAPPRRSRKPRDPTTSRRKRDIQKREQMESIQPPSDTTSDNKLPEISQANRFANEQDKDYDFDR